MTWTLFAVTLGAALTVSFCEPGNSGGQQAQRGAPPEDVRVETASARSEGTIRSVDFRNFTFPVCENVKPDILPRTETLTLKDGELEIKRGAQGNSDPVNVSLSNVSFHDLTGDGKEEAIVTLSTLLYPHGSTACVYVYTPRDNEPRRIWSYAFGTAAFGGLKKLAVENGELIIEEYAASDSAALCCPDKYVRSFYKWDGKDFMKVKSETLDNQSQRMN